MRNRARYGNMAWEKTFLVYTCHCLSLQCVGVLVSFLLLTIVYDGIVFLKFDKLTASIPGECVAKADQWLLLNRKVKSFY